MNQIFTAPTADLVAGIVPTPQAAATGADGAGARRKKLWELPAKFHCPVIGTCFTLDELRRLARKAGIEPATSDYALHHALVQLAGEPGYAAGLLQKTLERKFAVAIRRAGACKDPLTLAAFWEAALAQGEIAAAFWAVLTHPLGDAALVQQTYGEVHMRSHLAGHARRTADQQLPVLKQRIVALETSLGRASAAARARVRTCEQHAAALWRQVQHGVRLEQALAAAERRIAELEGGAALTSLRNENAALTGALEREMRRASDAERERDGWMQLAVTRGQDRSTPNPAVAAPAPPPIAERCAPDCDALAAGDCPGPDLCGRRILYVGGRERQLAHFRALVARRNGELLHHDGGRHESGARLDALIRAADAVLCPIECVSHDACRRIKRLCKRACKPFVPLRSASLAGFADGLRAVAS